MVPFHIQYALSRRQRLRVELVPWIPAIAGTIGFASGAAFLATTVSAWFLFLFLVPPVMYRSLFAFLFGLALSAGPPIELIVDETELELRAGGAVTRLPLGDLFQVFRSGSLWTVLHLTGTVITVPATAITIEQIEYLRAFAHRRAAVLRADARG